MDEEGPIAIASRTWTRADLVDWPEEVGKMVEIIDGALIAMPAPIPPHRLLTIEFVFDFREVVRPGRLGRIFTAPTDVLLSDGGVLQPDLDFIRSDRLSIVGKAVIEGPPDIMVGILSPSTRARDVGRKQEIYGPLGVPEHRIVDPERRTVTVLALRGSVYESLTQPGGVARSEALPDLAVDVAALFAAARR